MNRHASAWFAPLLLAVSVAAFAAGERERPASIVDRPIEPRSSYADVVRRVAPSVVSIYAAGASNEANTGSEGSSAQRSTPNDDTGSADRLRTPLSEKDRSREPTVSAGSGVIVDPAGLVVTASHVIANAERIRVVTFDAREYSAAVVLNDAKLDLALLRLAGEPAPGRAIALGNSDALEVGDTVLALGNPFGIGPTVTHGIISALGRVESSISDTGSFIQTDAAINPGNSGGALVDMNSRLIGINAAIISRSGGSEGVGFAIPVNVVRRMITQAQDGSTDGNRQ